MDPIEDDTDPQIAAPCHCHENRSTICETTDLIRTHRDQSRRAVQREIINEKKRADKQFSYTTQFLNSPLARAASRRSLISEEARKCNVPPPNYNRRRPPSSGPGSGYCVDPNVRAKGGANKEMNRQSQRDERRYRNSLYRDDKSCTLIYSCDDNPSCFTDSGKHQTYK